MLEKQKTSHSLEIIVADTCSTDGTQEYLEAKNIKTISISPTKFNYARTFNKAAALSKGDILVRLSGDVIPLDQNLIEELLWGLEQEAVAASYAKYICLDPKKRLPFSWPQKRFGKKKEIISEEPKSIIRDMLFNPKKFERLRNLAGGCCAIKREFWQQRPFNETVIEGEDCEYAFYLHNIGAKIAYNPYALVLHEHAPRKVTIKLMLRFIKIWLVLLREMYKTRKQYYNPK